MEKFYNGGAWLQYLIDHFLRRGAHAAASGDPRFAEFSFDHRMHGFVVGERHDTRELFALIVQDDDVDRVVLRDGDPETPWEAGFRTRDDLPWLAPYPRPWREPGYYAMPIEPSLSAVSALTSARAGSARRRPAAKKATKRPPAPE